MDERKLMCKKTTRWSVMQVEDLRVILLDCEEHSKLARKGGTSSVLRLDRQDANEDLKID